MDFCHLYWLPSTYPLCLMFGEFPTLCGLQGGIAHLLLSEENASYMQARGLGSVNRMFLPQTLNQELLTHRNPGTMENFLLASIVVAIELNSPGYGGSNTKKSRQQLR